MLSSDPYWKKKIKKIIFSSSCFSWQWGAQNHKGRLSEPTINFTTLQTSVVYIYSILTTNPPSFFDFFDFFRVLHHGKDHSFHSIARRAAVGRRKIVLCIAHFTKRYILHSIFMVVTVVFVAKSRVFYPCFKRDESIR